MQKRFFAIILFLFSFTALFAQTQSPVYLSQAIPDANVRGFYRYLPADYNTSGKSYPLILWIHGAGQVGAGNSAQLPRVLQYGVPKLINEGNFPASFSSGDSTFSFIIISPQFQAWPTGSNVAGMLSYIQSNYRINGQRIYMMGISAGGGAIMDYASISTSNSNKVAAMIPFCGTYSPTQTLANRVAATNLPLWFFHNTFDGTVPVAYSRNWRNYINGYSPAPVPLAKLTEFPVQSSDPVTAHECWSLATQASYKPQGINIYEWMLNYKRSGVPVNIAPFADAGADQVISLPSSVSLSASGSSDPDGSIATYRWTKVSGPAAYQFSDSTAMNTTVGNLSAGIYVFQLTVKDNLNLTDTDLIQVTVTPTISGDGERRVLIDAGPPTANGGALSGTPDNNGNYWNNMTDARVGVRVSNARTTTNQATSIGIEVINRIDGTYNTGGNGMNNVNSLGPVGIYPVSATNDYAFAHNSASNGRWRINGLQADRVYTIKFWGSKSYETRDRDIEIKLSTESTWKTYSAASNTNFNNAAYFTVTGVSQADFDIRAKSPSIFGYINVIDITFNEPSGNQPPNAFAGNDIVAGLQTPVSLDGCGSSDPENGLLQFSWRRLTGNTSVTIQSPAACNTALSNLLAGNYSFELTVTDTAGASDKDTVSLTINPPLALDWPVVPAPICSRAYKIVVLGSSTVAGTGASPLDSSWVNKFTAFVNQRNSQAVVYNLGLGGLNTYQVCPTGFSPPANRPQPDPNRNITAALSLQPDAIIVSLPSNDAASAYSLSETQQNLNTITAAADAAGIPIWVSTSQPRDGLSASQMNSLMGLRDWVLERFGSKAIDFWTTVANSNGTVNESFGAGDGIHLNNYGHHILFSRTVQERIWDTICLRYNPANRAPVAIAGNDRSITLPTNTVSLNGLNSYDPDGGGIVSYSWIKYSGPASGYVISQPSAGQTNVTFTNGGTFGFKLTVTDNLGGTGSDSVLITVIAANQPPVANAGSDRILQLPANSTLLDGRLSTDIDGAVSTYSWTLLSGPSGSTLLNPSKDTTTFRITNSGTYTLRLTVTDNGGLPSTDDVVVQVQPVTATGKRVNVNLYEGGIIFNNTGWNNWSPSSNVSSTPFKYSDGTQSTITSTLSSHPRFSDNGTGYGTGSTACPPEVLRLNSMHTINRTLSINGLAAGKTYVLEFYASRAFTSNSRSIFAVGNVRDTIDTDFNVNDYAKLNNVSADNAGRLLVNITFTGTYNYLAGFSIIEVNQSSRSFLAENNDDMDVNQNYVVVYPNPFKDFFEVRLLEKVEGSYTLLLSDMSGKTVHQQSGHKVHPIETITIYPRSNNQKIYRLILLNKNKTLHFTLAAF